ncbi:glycosyltransferase family 4 protein [Galbibacter orientalis]|uniref:glycosyltransferase family 4 protein n=1 Tax=Galbibacter orientalis TaxID=453852 RepID=UPI0030803FB7
MKNLHLISAMFVSKGHGFEYIRNFCSKLSDKYNITLHIASSPMPYNLPENIVVNYTNVDYSVTDAKNFIKFGLFGKYFRAIYKQYISFKYYRGVIKNKIVNDEDLVYIMDYDVIPLPYLVYSLSKNKIRIFIWIHSAKFKSKDFLYSLYKYFFKLFFKIFVYSHIEGIVVNGNYIKNKIVDYLDVRDDEVYVIQYPSEIKYEKKSKEESRKSLGLKSTDKVILFFGILREDKNIGALIYHISNSNVKTTLILAGSEGSVSKKDILFWINENRLENYILDINYISEEKIAMYYSAADLLMLTYNHESASQSGPLSLAREFLLPALVSDVGEIGDYVKENKVGLVADIEIEDDFSKKIDLFFNMDNYHNKFSESLYTAKNKYSWNSAKNEYVKLFK